jgi:predicted TPR repeat methyltransferase
VARLAVPGVALYDSVADVYDDRHSTGRERAENAVLRRLIARARWEAWLSDMNEPCRTLDFGCGTGLVLDLVRHEPEEYVGIDVSVLMLREAESRYPDHEWALGDVHRADAVMQHKRDAAVVTALFMLSITERPFDVLMTARECLRPGGRLVATFSTERRRPYSDFPDLLTTHTAAEAADLVGAAGFRVEGVSGLSAGRRSWGPLSRLVVEAERAFCRNLDRFQHIVVEASAV